MSLRAEGQAPTRGNLICDLDGVVYRGREPVEGSPAALAAIAAAGWTIIFSTNNSARTPEDVAERIEFITGYPARPEQVITSAGAAAQLLAESKSRTFVLGGPGVVAALEAEGIPVVTAAAEAEAVVVGLTFDLTYDLLRDAATAVMAGARLIATNQDPTYPAENGLWPGAGSIVAAVETATGVSAEVAGKPFPPMRNLIRSRLGGGEVWIVGDRPDTDLAMAKDEPAWHTALVLSGVTTEPIEPAPDMVAANLAEVVQALLAPGG
ncbi:MAG: HAD-IIA family hydrolase [Acidimicrobiia bacterium]